MPNTIVFCYSKSSSEHQCFYNFAICTNLPFYN